MAVVVCVVVRLDSVRMSLLGVRVLIASSVRVTAWAVAVTDVVEEYEADEVRGKTEGANYKHKLGLRDFLGLDKALDGFEEDGETQCDQEHAIYECTQGFCTLPLSRVSTVSHAIAMLYSHHMCTSSS